MPPTPFVQTVAAIFSQTEAGIATVRAANGLPPLVPSGKLLIGQEYLVREHAPPRIVIVPKGTAYEGAKPMQSQPGAGQIPPAKTQFLRWVLFEAHIWGDEDPAGKDALYSFDSTLELEREFFSQLAASGTIPLAHPLDGEWRQPTDVSKLGRLLVVNFRIGTGLYAEPYTTLPYSSTVGDGGVVRDVSVTIGSSTVVIPPIPP